jgi:hypothetical protein
MPISAVTLVVAPLRSLAITVKLLSRVLHRLAKTPAYVLTLRTIQVSFALVTVQRTLDHSVTSRSLAKTRQTLVKTRHFVQTLPTFPTTRATALPVTPEKTVTFSSHAQHSLVKTKASALIPRTSARTLVSAHHRTLETIVKSQSHASSVSPQRRVKTAVSVLTPLTSPITLALVRALILALTVKLKCSANL